MKERRINKKYVALISGIPTPPEGRIDAPIARESEGSILRVVREDGKAAVTDYKLLGITDSGDSVCEITLAIL